MSQLDELAPGEEVLLRARKTTFILADTVILTLLTAAFVVIFYTMGWLRGQSEVARAGLAFSPFIIAILLLINDIIGFQSMELIVTNKRVLGKTGIAALNLIDVQLDRITDIKVDMSFTGSIFDYGALTILTPSGEYLFNNIHDPLRIRTTINEAMY